MAEKMTREQLQERIRHWQAMQWSASQMNNARGVMVANRELTKLYKRIDALPPVAPVTAIVPVGECQTTVEATFRRSPRQEEAATMILPTHQGALPGFGNDRFVYVDQPRLF